ncbi:heptaprenyl diphosphate synthase [Paenibacillaceae bacterium]|nr:heptaprenyl diphosphate synthase [Paenibacillaceae bacterium]
MTQYRIPEIASKYFDYDLIRHYTELPDFPHFRTRLLYAFLLHERKATDQSELYALVVALVQMAMDTHDLIDTDTNDKETARMRSRQLKVLAGDYFSSRFYHLLAQAGQIEMIGQLSAAVCETNRLKMNLYTEMQRPPLAADKYLEYHVQLRTQLYEGFSQLFEGSLSGQWLELLQCFSRCETINDELSRTMTISRFQQSFGFWLVWPEGTEEERRRLQNNDQLDDLWLSGLVDKYQIRERLVEKLQGALAHLELTAGRLDSDKLAVEVRAIAQSFLHPLASAAPAFNEMR